MHLRDPRMGNPLAFLRFAWAEVLRSRRIISAAAGIILAVVFVAGTFIAIDSSAQAVLVGQLSFAESDFTIRARTPETQAIVAELAAIRGVEALAPFRHLDFDEVGRWNGTSLRTEGIGVDPTQLPRLLAEMELRGQSTLGPDSAVVSEGIANLLRVGIGERIFLRGTVMNETSGSAEARYVNLTIQGILVPGSPPWNPRFSSSRPPTEFVAVHIDETERTQRALSDRYFPRINIEVFVDRGLLNPYDLEATERELARLERALNQVASRYEGTVSNVISVPLGNLQAFNTLSRGLFLAISLPLIILALYVAAIGVDLGHEERRRDLALLKSRGTSDQQVFGLLLVESVLVGLIAAVLGLLGGIALSRLLLGAITAFAGSEPRFEDFVLSPGTIIGTIALSVLFALAASYRSAKRTRRLPVTESLRSSPRVRKGVYRPTVDLVLVTIGAASFAVAFAGPAFGGFFLFLTGSLFFVLLPLAPALVILGATRLLIHSSPGAFEGASRILKPVTGSLYYLIARNLARHPRRASSLAVIIALGLAYGLFVSALFASQAAWEDRSLRAVIGADVAALFPSRNESLLQEVGALTGVSAVTEISSLPSSVEDGLAEVFALDPASYFEITDPDPWYFANGGSSQAQSVLSREGWVVISLQYRRDSFFEVGDGLRLTYETRDSATQEVETRALEVTVGGVVRGLPGTISDARNLPRAIYGSFATFRPILEEAVRGEAEGPEFAATGGSKLLMDVEEGADLQALRSTLFEYGSTRVDILGEGQAVGGLHPTTAAFQSFLRLEFAFIAVALTAGLGLLVYAASREREREFGAIVARGASRWQTASILLGEGLSIVMVGLAVAALVGIAASYLGTQTFLLGPGESEVLVPFPFVLPAEGILLMALTAVAMFLANLFLAVRMSRLSLARILGIKGG